MRRQADSVTIQGPVHHSPIQRAAMSIGKTSVYFVPPVLLVFTLVGLPLRSQGIQTQGGRFQLEEATITDVHRAIQAGQLTCRGLVQAYIDRAKAYNGVSDRLGTRG